MQLPTTGQAMHGDCSCHLWAATVVTGVFAPERRRRALVLGPKAPKTPHPATQRGGYGVPLSKTDRCALRGTALRTPIRRLLLRKFRNSLESRPHGRCAARSPRKVCSGHASWITRYYREPLPELTPQQAPGSTRQLAARGQWSVRREQLSRQKARTDGAEGRRPMQLQRCHRAPRFARK